MKIFPEHKLNNMKNVKFPSQNIPAENSSKEDAVNRIFYRSDTPDDWSISIDIP